MLRTIFTTLGPLWNMEVFETDWYVSSILHCVIIWTGIYNCEAIQICVWSANENMWAKSAVGPVLKITFHQWWTFSLKNRPAALLKCMNSKRFFIAVIDSRSYWKNWKKPIYLTKFLSDLSPIIVNPCHSLSNSITAVQ